MLKLEDLALRGLLVLVVLGVIGVAAARYLDRVEQRGYDRAVADGEKTRKADAEEALKAERKLRAMLAAEQKQRFEESQAHAKNIADLQAAARAGAERLRCPATRPVPTAPAPADRSAAAGAEPANGPELMPEATADVFGLAGSIAEVVRQRNALIIHFNAARAACIARTIPGADHLPDGLEN